MPPKKPSKPPQDQWRKILAILEKEKGKRKFDELISGYIKTLLEGTGESEVRMEALRANIKFIVNRIIANRFTTGPA